MTKKHGIIASLFIGIFALSALAPPPSYALVPACPANVNQNDAIGVTSPRNESNPYYKANDFPYTPADNSYTNGKFDFNVDVPYPPCNGDPERAICSGGVPVDPKKVNFGVGLNASQSLFTQIYANFLGMVPTFVLDSKQDINAQLESNPALKADWDRYYCLKGLDDKSEGKFVTTGTGSITYRIEKKTGTRTLKTTSDLPPRSSCENLPPDRSPPRTCGCWNEDYTGVQDKSYCYNDTVAWVETEKTSPFTDAGKTIETQVPFTDGLREIAKKVATTLKEQYCIVGTEKTCLNGYECIPFDKLRGIYPALNEKDAAAQGKNGMCLSKQEDGYAYVNFTPVKLTESFCTDITSLKYDVGTLSSNMCYYTDSSLGLTQCTDGNCTGNKGYPYLADSDISSPTNSLPFDTALFADNGETTNPNCGTADGKNCILDGYYRRAFVNKLSGYTDEEKKWYDNLPGYTDAAGKIYDAERMTGKNATYYKDMIEDLGKYVEISNDARFLNQNLLPTGSRVVKSFDNTAYLRAVNNADRGVLFVNGHPIGALPTLNSDGTLGERLNNSQYAPFIYTNPTTKQFVVTTMVKNDLYMMLSGLQNNLTRLQKIPTLSTGQEYTRMFGFVNTTGDVIVGSGTNGTTNGNFIYSIYNGQTKTFSGASQFPDIIGKRVAMYLDQYDNLHVLGSQFYDSAGNSLYYAKYKFNNGGLSEIIGPKKVTFPAEVFTYGELGAGPMDPFSIAPDNLGGALIVVNLAVVPNPGSSDYWWDNHIYFATIPKEPSINGDEITPAIQEYAVRDDISRASIPQSIKSFGDGIPLVNHQLQGYGPFVSQIYDSVAREFQVTIVYNRAVYFKTGNAGKIYQTMMAKRANGNWIQDIPLTEIISDQIGHVGYPNIDVVGNISVSLMDKVTKYDSANKLFDAAGYKQCVFPSIPQIGTKYCGLITPTTQFVIPPTNSSTGKMEFGPMPRFE